MHTNSAGTYEHSLTLHRDAFQSTARLHAHLEGQMVYGCENQQCRNSLCYTGRCNVSTAPVRAYTVSSARMIALCLSATPNSTARACVFYKERPDVDHGRPSEERLDKTSLLQQLSNTSIIRRAMRAHRPSTTLVNRVDRLQKDCSRLQLVRERPFNPDGSRNGNYLDNAAAIKVLCQVLFSQAMFHECREVATELCEIWSYRVALDAVMDRATDSDEKIGTLLDVFLSERATTLQDPNLDEVMTSIHLVFQCHWLGKKAVLRLNSIPHGAMDLIQILYPYESRLPDPSGPLFMTAIWMQIDRVHAVETWLSGCDSSARHMLSYPHHLTDAAAQHCFKIACYIRMRHTHTAAMQMLGPSGLEIGRPVPGSMYDRVRLDFNEALEMFLVLRIHRTHVLEDAFDQLWQRRPSELHKPLRVRIVEGDGQAMGQDLGGVQIEFFNLVMHEALREDAGLFTTNETGYTYFRPGSLQPLHMFELMGMLVGLALFNGIPLPVNFPLALYQAMLNQKPDFLRDRWPAKASTVEQLLLQTVTADWGLVYEFDLHANGLGLSIPGQHLHRHRREQNYLRSCTELTSNVAVSSAQRVGDAVASVNRHVPSGSVAEPRGCDPKDVNERSDTTAATSPSSIAVESLKWPGWSFEATSGSYEAVAITELNKVEFTHDLSIFETVFAVMPQMRAFLKGFDQLVHPRTLDFIKDPRTLQNLLEGTKDVDIDNLMAVTSYEGGFNSNSEYVKLFWKIVKSWSPEQHKALLRFVTAAERYPCDFSLFTFKLARDAAGHDEGRLPTCSTCFSTLYLPVYQSEETLRKKLLTAIELGEYGFGMG